MTEVASKNFGKRLLLYHIGEHMIEKEKGNDRLTNGIQFNNGVNRTSQSKKKKKNHTQNNKNKMKWS